MRKEIGAKRDKLKRTYTSDNKCIEFIPNKFKVSNIKKMSHKLHFTTGGPVKELQT